MPAAALLARHSAVMEQPPLDHHHVVMHLGGAKPVTRRRDGPAVSTVADDGSLTLVLAGTAFAWRTEGPIAFAHLRIPPRQLEDVVAREFSADGRGISLIEQVGCQDRFLEQLGTGRTSTCGRPRTTSAPPCRRVHRCPPGS